MTRQRTRRWLASAAAVLAALALSALAAGCGSSGSGASSPSPSSSLAATTLARADVVAFVESAIAYADANGKDAALAAFSDPQGQFVDGELYIFAYDFNGKNLAHGQDPTLVGKDLIDLTDPKGQPIIKEFVQIARQGDGWLSYCWANPAHSNRVESKLAYITKVDDAWLIGAGMYTDEIVESPQPTPAATTTTIAPGGS